MASTNAKDDLLVLDGVVRYRLTPDGTGQTFMDARWVSTRIANGGQTGTGHAVRQASSTSNDKYKAGFEGDWTIKYFGPDGQLAVTAFLLRLTKNGQVYHGEWSLPTGDPVLEGFGFEEAGQLVMRYGNL